MAQPPHGGLRGYADQTRAGFFQFHGKRLWRGFLGRGELFEHIAEFSEGLNAVEVAVSMML